MGAHTPGPWYVDYMAVGDEDVGQTGWEPSGEFFTIDSVGDDEERHEPVSLYSPANAQLVAASPVLLAALEAVAADIGDDQSEAWVTPPVKRLVLAAIATAKRGSA